MIESTVSILANLIILFEEESKFIETNNETFWPSVSIC